MESAFCFKEIEWGYVQNVYFYIKNHDHLQQTRNLQIGAGMGMHFLRLLEKRICGKAPFCTLDAVFCHC